MTVATEKQVNQAPDFSLVVERTYSAEEVEYEVLQVLDDVLDPTTETHQLFYGDPGVLGVEKTHLTKMQTPLGGCRVYTQFETEHTCVVDGNKRVVPAFKRRGAWLAVLRSKLYNPELRETTAASSGNHAKGLLTASQQLGMTATIFMTESSDPTKQASLRELGAVLDTSSKTLEEAMQRAEEYASQSDIIAHVHPYNHYEVIAGQATSAVEALESLLLKQQQGELDLHNDRVLVTVPLGGGGYAAATGIVFKRARDNGLIGDNVRVLAVQPEDKPHNLFCDGTMTQTGEKAQAILHDERYVQGVVTVKNEEIAEAVAWIYQTTGKRIEPAGALAVSLATTQIARGNDVLVAMVSGASISPNKFELCLDLAEQNGYDMSFLSTAAKSLAARVKAGTRVWNGQ